MAVTSTVVTVATVAPVDEVQVVTVTATGGTFTAAFGGDPTAALDFDITSADFQTALEGLDEFAPGDVTVAGDGPHTITYGGVYAGTDVALLTIDDAEATGGTVAATVTTPGSARTAPVRLDTQAKNDRRAGSTIRVRNTGADPAYIGGPAVDTTEGYLLGVGVTFPFAIDLDDGEGLYAVSGDGDPTSVTVLETGV